MISSCFAQNLNFAMQQIMEALKFNHKPQNRISPRREKIEKLLKKESID